MHNPTLRVLGVLQEITKSPGGIRLSDLSRQLQIPKTTLLPIVQTLCQTHYLSVDEHGVYSAGTALFSLGAAFSGCFPGWIMSVPSWKHWFANWGKPAIAALWRTVLFSILTKWIRPSLSGS